MAWLGLGLQIFPTTLCRGVIREREKDEIVYFSYFEPTSVELHQTGTFGRMLCRLIYSAAASIEEMIIFAKSVKMDY